MLIVYVIVLSILEGAVIFLSTLGVAGFVITKALGYAAEWSWWWALALASTGGLYYTAPLVAEWLVSKEPE